MAKRELSERNRQWLAAEMRRGAREGLVVRAGKRTAFSITRKRATAGGKSAGSATTRFDVGGGGSVGLAALLLIGYNWEAMPKPAKLAVIFGVIAVTHGAGFWLRYDRKARGLSEVVFFLGCLFYGCGIWLVAQI